MVAWVNNCETGDLRRHCTHCNGKFHMPFLAIYDYYIDGLSQDCSISIANAMEILQSYTKPSIYANAALLGSLFLRGMLGDRHRGGVRHFSISSGDRHKDIHWPHHDDMRIQTYTATLRDLFDGCRLANDGIIHWIHCFFYFYNRNSQPARW